MKKAQVWMTDMTLSILIFSAASVIAFGIIMNSFQTQNDFSDMKRDASRISEYFLSEGTPKDWNETTVIRPGVMTGNRINQTKLEMAMLVTNSSYDAMKSSLQTRHDFIIVIENNNRSIIPAGDLCAFGKSGMTNLKITDPTKCEDIDFSLIDPDNLVRIVRFSVYESRVVRVVVYLWD